VFTVSLAWVQFAAVRVGKVADAGPEPPVSVTVATSLKLPAALFLKNSVEPLRNAPVGDEPKAKVIVGLVLSMV